MHYSIRYTTVTSVKEKVFSIIQYEIQYNDRNVIKRSERVFQRDSLPGIAVVACDVDPGDEANDRCVDQPGGIVSEEGEVHSDLLAEVILHSGHILSPRQRTAFQFYKTDFNLINELVFLHLSCFI